MLEGDQAPERGLLRKRARLLDREEEVACAEREDDRHLKRGQNSAAVRPVAKGLDAAHELLWVSLERHLSRRARRFPREELLPLVLPEPFRSGLLDEADRVCPPGST